MRLIPSLSTTLYVGAVILRFFVLGYQDYFLDRPELVTPLTSIKRLKEGLFLEETGLSPYAGTAFHQPPLILTIFKLPVYINLTSFFVILLDLWTAYLLFHITKLYNQSKEAKTDRFSDPPASMPHMVALLYLYLPFSWLSSAAQSTGSIENIAILFTLYYALKGNAIAAILSLSFASYLALYPVQLLLPLFYLLPRSDNKAIIMIILFIASSVMLFLASNQYNNSSMDWIYESYGFQLKVEDLTPNIGLFWYFFLEVFDHFRTFFCCVLQLNCFLYVVPLTLSFKQKPVLLFWLLLAYITTLKPYPSVVDLSLQFGLLPLFYPIIAEFIPRFLVLIQFYIGSMFILPIAWYAWLYQGSGNANFYYANTLVIGIAQVWLIIEILHITLEREYKRKHNLEPFNTADANSKIKKNQ